jgi:adenylosuccinate synthase
VGEGPFPTELHDEIGAQLCEIGSRVRHHHGPAGRCGWLDLVALKYAARVNGLTGLCITKLDVLNSLDTIKVCTGYRVDGKETASSPRIRRVLRGGAHLRGITGWKTDISGVPGRRICPPATTT